MDFNAIIDRIRDALSASDGNLLPLILLFGTIFFLVIGVAQLFRSRDDVERRLAGEERQDIERQRDGDDKRPSLRYQDGQSVWNQLLKPLGDYVTPDKEQDKPRLRKRLIQAGYLNPNAVRTYFAARLVLSAALPGIFVLAAPFVVPEMQTRTVLLCAVGAALLGYYLPFRVVQSKLEKRQSALSDAFPDALDMLVVCVEAGLGLDAAFARVGQQLASAHPELAQEFAIVSLSLRAGKTREQALRDLAERTGVGDIQSFATLLIQSDNLGASIAQTLRVQADEMRVKRMLRAEEKAHKLPVKMVVPLVTCILPAMLVAVLLPGIISIARNVMPALGG